jgi:hypothetical protein
MSIDWTEPKTWQERGQVAGELTAVRKRLSAQPLEGYAQAVPDVLDLLALQRRGMGFLFDALNKIQRYNEAAHDQQSRQRDVVQALMTALKEQDRQIRKLDRRVVTLERKLAKLSTRR